MNSPAALWPTLTEFNGLWIIDRNPQDPWYAYFDQLFQFELSRSRRQFRSPSEPWVFSGARYVPASMVMLADFSEESLNSQLEIWKGLGSPKALVFTTSRGGREKFTAQDSDRLRPVEEAP